MILAECIKSRHEALLLQCETIQGMYMKSLARHVHIQARTARFLIRLPFIAILIKSRVGTFVLAPARILL